MKRQITFVLALFCLLGLTGCKKETHLEIGHAASLSLRSGLTGDAAEIIDTEVIAYITENLNAIAFEKGRLQNEGENGYAYSLRWYDENQTRVASLYVMDECTVVYDGRYYNGMEADNEIDTEYLRMLTEKQDSEPIPDAPEDTWGVTMTARDVTPAGLTLVIRHSGNAPAGQLETGSYFWVEVRDGDVWKAVPEVPLEDGIERGWTSIAYLIPVNDSREDKVNFTWLYGELPAGQYRIGKEIMLFRGTGDYDKQTYYAEFEIK